MEREISILMITAASIGFVHTILGPDHYIPFIVMAKARNWSLFKTSWITILCGLGHVGSSVVFGIIGIAAGIGISKIEGWESFRGGLAAWAFIIFGFIYFLWGMWRALKKKPHSHLHVHKNGSTHRHDHNHTEAHDHYHGREKVTKMTPWILFLIFVLGPCEPLIPILMYPAAQNSTGGLILVTIVFALITIVTMLIVVLIFSFGITKLPFGKLERYTHAIAGGIIFLSGVGIQFLNL